MRKKFLEIVRKIFWTNFYLTLLLLFQILLILWYFDPQSSLLKALERDETDISPVEYNLMVPDNPKMEISQISFSVTEIEHKMLNLRFNVEKNSFDFFRISGLSEFPSGFYSFRDGQIQSLHTCPDFTKNLTGSGNNRNSRQVSISYFRTEPLYG